MRFSSTAPHTPEFQGAAKLAARCDRTCRRLPSLCSRHQGTRGPLRWRRDRAPCPPRDVELVPLTHLRDGSGPERRARPDAPEAEVLALVAEGWTTGRSAGGCIREKTASVHVSRLRQAGGAGTRGGAAAIARRRGLLRLRVAAYESGMGKASARCPGGGRPRATGQGPRPGAVTCPAAPPAAVRSTLSSSAPAWGLATAQALSRHFERVTLIDRDDLPSGPPAARVSLRAATSAYSARRAGGAGRLLPGFGAELVARGAVKVTAPRDVCWLSAAGWMRPFDGQPPTMLSASRDLIETRPTPGDAVRPALGGPALELGLRGRRPGGRRRSRVGVQFRDGARRREPPESIVADLVIDASGRRSHAPDWLAEAGTSGREIVRRRFRLRTRTTGGPTTTPAAGRPCSSRPSRRTATAWRDLPHRGRPLDADLAGTNGDVPPTDEAGFPAFAWALRSPVIADVIERLEPLSPIAGYRHTTTGGATTSSCAGRTGSWWWAMPPVPSTPSTPRA